MPKLHKSNRSLAKRIKVTSSGKLIKRKQGQNHFNAKNSGAIGLQRKGYKAVSEELTKRFQKLLPNQNIAS